MKNRLATLPLAVVLLGTHCLCAEVITWTNLSGGFWNAPANWSPNQVPLTNDTAIITNAGVYTVTLNVNPNLAGLILGGASGTQTLATAERSLALNGPAEVRTNGHLYLSGGVLSGPGPLYLQGTWTWRNGTVNTNAAVYVAPGAQATLSSSGKYSKTLNGSVTNAGAITWAPLGDLILGGTLHTVAGGMFEVTADNSSILAGGSGALINDGTFRKTSGAGSINCYVPLINHGTVDVETGTLALLAPSVFNSGCSFVGSGRVNVQAGTNLLSGSIHSENLTLQQGATLIGAGSFSGTLTWEGGSLGADGALTVATNGQLLIGSAFQHAKSLNGALTNAGTILWSPNGSLVLGGVLHNLTDALFDIRTGNSILASGPNPIFINEGTVRRTEDSGVTSCQVPLINSGTVDVRTGRLELPGGSVLRDGSSFTGAGRIRMTTGTNILGGTIHSDNLELSGATLAGAGLITGSFTWSAGTIDGALSFNVTRNSALTIGNGFSYTKSLNGNLTNAGTVTWLPTGSLLLSGVLHNLPGGRFDIQTDSTLGSNAPAALIINEGILQKSAGGGTAGCTSRLINYGVVEIASGRLSCAGGFCNPAGTISLAGGVFQNNEPIHLAGGLLTGWGSVNATVTNAATVRPGSTNGVLTINGDYQQTLAGITVFDLGGNQPGTNQSQLRVAGRALLGGCIHAEWANGYLPLPGTDFAVMSFISHVGEFDCHNGFFLLGHERRLTPVYASNSLILSAVAAAEPVAVPLGVTVADGSALVAWPLEFTGYELYWNTNLSETNWTLLPAAANRWLQTPLLMQQGFFRLKTINTP